MNEPSIIRMEKIRKLYDTGKVKVEALKGSSSPSSARRARASRRS
jgi:hypothetical protein